MNRITHIDKEFTPSQAGDRVGWVRVNPTENKPFVAIDVVTGTVIGDEGAQVGYQQWGDQENDPNAPVSNFQKGFGKVAAFSALLSSEHHWQEESNLRYTSEGHQSRWVSHYVPKAQELLANGTGGNNHHMDGAEKVWVDSPAELLDTLKQLLGDADIASAYQIIYYWMNGAIGREYPDRSALYGVDPAELLLVDAKMNVQTRGQIDQMLRIERALSQSLMNDTNMRGRLTGFIADTPMEKLPEVFVGSRTKAAEAEQQIRDAAGRLVVKKLAYLPAGARRTWPYMDAAEPDATKAYGPELRDLRARKTARAIAEIDQEVVELESRHTLASESIQRFRLLDDLERAL